MKIITLLIALLSLSTYAQEEEDDIKMIEVDGPHFCYMDTIWYGDRMPPREGACNMEQTGGKNYYTFGNYQSFSIVSDSLKEAYQTLLEYDLVFPENGKYESLGKFKVHELQSASKDEDPSSDGKYRKTWAFYPYIEVDFNGEYMRFKIPAVKNKNLSSEPHFIYIPKDCIKNCLNTFKYK